MYFMSRCVVRQPYCFSISYCYAMRSRSRPIVSVRVSFSVRAAVKRLSAKTSMSNSRILQYTQRFPLVMPPLTILPAPCLPKLAKDWRKCFRRSRAVDANLSINAAKYYNNSRVVIPTSIPRN